MRRWAYEFSSKDGMRGGWSFQSVFKSTAALAASTLNQHQRLCRVAHDYINVLIFFMAE